jgi:hypothetical protein
LVDEPVMITVEKPHVHGEWTDHDTHRTCQRAGWCCTRCGQDHATDPGRTGCVRCGYTVLAPLWKLASR